MYIDPIFHRYSINELVIHEQVMNLNFWYSSKTGKEAES